MVLGFFSFIKSNVNLNINILNRLNFPVNKFCPQASGDGKVHKADVQEMLAAIRNQLIRPLAYNARSQ